MRDIAITILIAFNAVILVYFVILNSVYLLTSLVAFRDIKRYVRRLKSLDLGELLSSEGVPPVTSTRSSSSTTDHGIVRWSA